MNRQIRIAEHINSGPGRTPTGLCNNLKDLLQNKYGMGEFVLVDFEIK